jgi:hypothetical protein
MPSPRSSSAGWLSDLHIFQKTASVERVASLFLLFLQEIISERSFFTRRNAGVTATWQAKEQRCNSVFCDGYRDRYKRWYER